MSVRRKENLLKDPVFSEPMRFAAQDANDSSARCPSLESEPLLVDQVLRFLEQYGYSAA
ncbi:MAG: hypothetical protein IRZ03_11275 [Acidobacterium ailaaui]|jgi:hypothetical protein|nr:hypothetical protein [Pseudacidobacterium ailaaui]